MNCVFEIERGVKTAQN